ncbi:PREDICTED: uncharacterized protein LOC109169473 [Ipomoea nil]|uniref:uncharacterized protein LOC109169473 n=1 Tax=Ipomoea nil TaxID=35883 RepID=UPI0009015926|nr:PREDICTED: uncharacterized protein LOC109169473 [Ipomoea nil]
MEYKHVIAVPGMETTLDDDVISKSDDEFVKMHDSPNHASHSEDIMVGKINEFETITMMLIQHSSKQQEVVSIRDDINGSRVLLTTRVAEVAICIDSNNYFSHQMQFLDPSESWDLFCKKLCKSHGVEFETIGRAIVEKCKGLPLAIVVMMKNVPHIEL